MNIEPIGEVTDDSLRDKFNAFELWSSDAILPTAFKVMAHCPDITKAVIDLGMLVMGEEGRRSSPGLRWMVGNIASRAAGCRFCEAHTAHYGVERGGLDEVKAAALWEFETSSLFDAAERAALHLALAGGQVPNLVTPEHFTELRKYYDVVEIVEIVAVISFFGLANRWNDTVATSLEPGPLATGERLLAANGWRVGKHQPAEDRVAGNA